jgi:FkbM family methyltransferase
LIRTILRNTFEHFPAAALFYRNMRDLLDQRQSAMKTPWGFTLAGNAAMASGDYEPNETAVVRQLLHDADILVNVGANVGYYCCHALSMGKPVIAIEPISRNLHYLLKNIRDNGWAQQAQVFPIALGADTNVLHLWGGRTGASLLKGWASISENYVTQVPVLSLDRVLGDNMQGKRALILVDIEGAEYMMLQGAVNALRNHPKPIWMMEISTTEHQPVGIAINPHFSKTFKLFFAEGYRAFTADVVALEVTEEVIQQVIQGAQRLRTHNFIFRSD